MVRREHLHAVQSYLVLICVYIYIYIRIDHVCVCVSMYGLGFADRLVLAMPCGSHIWMGDGPLCIAAYVWFRLVLCLMVVRCDDYLVVNAFDVYYWHCFYVGHCYPATIMFRVYVCRYIVQLGLVILCTSALRMLGLVLYLFRELLSVYLCSAFGLLYSTIPCCVEHFYSPLNLSFSILCSVSCWISLSGVLSGYTLHLNMHWCKSLCVRFYLFSIVPDMLFCNSVAMLLEWVRLHATLLWLIFCAAAMKILNISYIL